MERELFMSMGDADVASIAGLLADPARARIVLTLTDGRPLDAGGLVRAAGLTASATSAHLKKLVLGGLLTVERRGRHRYFQLADPELVALVEKMAALARPKPARTVAEAYTAKAIRLARMCYDHLAGVLGVAISDALVNDGSLITAGNEYDVTPHGLERFAAIGIDTGLVAIAARR